VFFLVVTNNFGLVSSLFSVIMTLNESDCCLKEFVVTVLEDSCKRNCLFQGSDLLAGSAWTRPLVDVAHTVSKPAFRKAFVGPVIVHYFVMKRQELVHFVIIFFLCPELKFLPFQQISAAACPNRIRNKTNTILSYVKFLTV